MPNHDKNKDTFRPMIAGDQPFKGSGKENNQLTHPVVSMSGADGNKQVNPSVSANDEIEFLSDVYEPLVKENRAGLSYPFDRLEVGGAFLVKTQPNQTTDKLFEEMNTIVYNAKIKYAEVEKDENGNDILDQVTIKTRLTNDDGTIQLTNNEPVTGADFKHIPKYIFLRNFIVKAVTKDQEIGDKIKVSADGVMVIRVS